MRSVAAVRSEQRGKLQRTLKLQLNLREGKEGREWGGKGQSGEEREGGKEKRGEEGTGKFKPRCEILCTLMY